MAGLLTLAFRKNRAKVRYWLWLSASLKFFVPFALLMSFGSHLDWAPVAQRMMRRDGRAAGLLRRWSVSPHRFPNHCRSRAAAHGAANWTPYRTPWIRGSCGFAGDRAHPACDSWLRVRAAVRASAPLPIPAAVEIRSSPGLLEPGVVGLLRPVLLLPEGIMERLTPSQLDAVLAHELCHVRRRDNLSAAIHMIVEALFLVSSVGVVDRSACWWRSASEPATKCVLTAGSEPRIYADAILNVCKLYMESPLVCVSGVTGSNLKRRIEAIMTNRTGQGLNRAKKFLLAAAGIAALAVPVAIGIVIGIGNAPAIHAQPSAAAAPSPLDVPQAIQPEVTQPTPAVGASTPAQALPVPAAPAADQDSRLLYKDRRLIAMMFDLDTMTSDDQTRARQSAAEFVRTRMAPADLVALMTVSGDEVKVLQDFTADHSNLESTLLKVGREGNSATAGIAHRLFTIETAAHILGGLAGRKALIYFASGVEQPGANDQAELRRAIDAAIKSNVAIYTIDAHGLIPQIMPQDGPVGAPAGPQLGPGAPQEEHSRRGVKTPSVIEGDVHIDWPPPLATYWSDRAADATLSGLPSGHFFVQVRAAGEYQEVFVPIGGYSGQVQISGQIKSLPNTPQAGASFGHLVRAVTGDYQATVILAAGSYACSVLVTELATGKTYGETVVFEVK